MTTTPTSGAADLPEALRSIQRFEVVDCIDDKHVPAVIPNPHGPWVRYEDHIAALAAGQATAAKPVAPPNAITAAIVRDDGGEAPAFCLTAACRSEKDAMDAFALIAAAQPANTKTHDLLSTTIGLLMGYREGAARQPYKPGSVIDKTVAEAVEHLKAWPYAEPTTASKPAAQQGVAYAALTEKYYLAGGEVPTWDAKQMHAFADATHTLRASHGQAPAQPATVHCKDRNCAAVDGYGHSDECASDHERAASGLDTAGNRNPVARYDGYRGAPCNPAYTKDQQAAWLEGYEARNRQGITPSPQADNKKKDPL